MVCVFLLYYHPRRRPEFIVYCEIKAYVRKSSELVPQRFDRITLHKSHRSKIEVCASPILLGHYVTHMIYEMQVILRPRLESVDTFHLKRDYLRVKP